MPVCNFSKFEIIRFLGCFGVWDTKILHRVSSPGFISHKVKNIVLCLLLKICFSFDCISVLCTTFLLKKNSHSIDVQKVKMLNVSSSPSPHSTLLPISSWSVSFVSECLCVGVCMSYTCTSACTHTCSFYKKEVILHLQFYNMEGLSCTDFLHVLLIST